MNKSQLVSTMAASAGLSISKAEKTLAVALTSIVDTLIQGESVSLVGFGSFGVKRRAARKVRNPKTGEEMQIQSTIVPFFKVSKNLKDQVDTKD